MTASRRPSGSALRRSITTALLTALALLAALSVPAATATAAPDGDATADSQLLVVLDASSSMLEPATDGGTRADAARGALLGVVDTLGEDERVGLRQFGATVVGLDDPASCTDSQLTVPIATDNRQALRDAANAYLPYGETPIAHALAEAGKDLGTQGQRTILLISDGESNCDPDPCTMAAELAAQGTGLTIHVVGFDVTGAARDALACVAAAGGGQYFDVTDSAGLAAVFTRVSTRAFRDFALSGESVQGTPAVDDAPTLTGPTTYLTPLPEVGGTLNYRIARTIPGSRLWVTVTMGRGPAEKVEGVLRTSTEADASTCNSSQDFASAFSGDWNVPVLTLDSTDRDKCTSAEAMLLTLTTRDGGEAFAGALAEILVHEEAPITNGADLPEATEDLGAWVPIPDATPTPVVGGLAFSDAPVLGNGSYSFDLLPGEVAYLRVPLDWGQSLQARTTSTQRLDLTLHSPVRQRISSNKTQIELPVGSAGTDSGGDLWQDAIRTPPVTYRAREHEGDWDEALAHAGTWTIAVTAERTDDAQPGVPVPVTLDLLVDGAVGGAPAYVAAPAASSAPASDAPDAPTTAEASPSSSPPVGADSGGGIPAVVPIVVGLAGAALLAGGTWMLVRRRRAIP